MMRFRGLIAALSFSKVPKYFLILGRIIERRLQGLALLTLCFATQCPTHEPSHSRSVHFLRVAARVPENAARVSISCDFWEMWYRIVLLIISNSDA